MCIHVRKTLFWNIHSNIPTEKKLQLLQLLKKMHVQCMLQNWTMCLALGSQTFIGKHEKESDVKDLFGSFCKTCLNVYERAISAIWIIHKKYQILIVFWLCEWKIVLIRLKPSALHWKICVFLSTFWMAKLKTFPHFSGVLILLSSSIYLFKFKNTKTRMTLMTSLWCHYCC